MYNNRISIKFIKSFIFIYPIVLVEFAAKDIVPIETVIAADFITVGLSVCALNFTNQNKLDVKKH